MRNNNGIESWNEWRKHVLLELEALREDSKELKEFITNIRIDIAPVMNKAGEVDKINKKLDKTILDVTTLKTKAAVYGSIAAGIVSIIIGIIIKII
jgi:DNA polymerase sigma